MAIELIRSGDDRAIQACFQNFIKAIATETFNNLVILRSIGVLAGWSFIQIQKTMGKKVADDALKVFIDQMYSMVKNNGNGYELLDINVTITSQTKLN
jgi:hypothetical protein